MDVRILFRSREAAGLLIALGALALTFVAIGATDGGAGSDPAPPTNLKLMATQDKIVMGSST